METITPKGKILFSNSVNSTGKIGVETIRSSRIFSPQNQGYITLENFAPDSCQNVPFHF